MEFQYELRRRRRDNQPECPEDTRPPDEERGCNAVFGAGSAYADGGRRGLQYTAGK